MKKYFFLLVVVFAFAACHTPQDVAYLSDIDTTAPIKTPEDGYIRFMPGDRLNIHVHSRDWEQMRIFNIRVGYGGWGDGYYGNGYGDGDGGYGYGYGYGGGNNSAYTVDTNGYIDFPVLGKVYIEGQTRVEVARTIKDSILARNLCTDPTVSVNFTQMNVTVMGSVRYPGPRYLYKDRTTLLEALSMARDLDIDGMRVNVLVMRQEGETRVPYKVDLTKTEDLYKSPAYYVKQNDIIYVEPNDKVKRNSTVMASAAYNPSFWLSILSVSASLTLAVFSIFSYLK